MIRRSRASRGLSQPGQPERDGGCGRRAHRDARHGTGRLLACGRFLVGMRLHRERGLVPDDADDLLEIVVVAELAET